MNVSLKFENSSSAFVYWLPSILALISACLNLRFEFSFKSLYSITELAPVSVSISGTDI